MENDADGSVHVTLPRSILTIIGLSLIAGGAGAGFTLGPQFEKQTVLQCFDQSSTALQLSREHSAAIAALKADIAENRRFIYSRTEGQYTAHQAAEQRAQQTAVDRIQDQRLDYLEKRDSRKEDR